MSYSTSMFFFFQAEDGIRDLVRSRGLGDVYKRQVRNLPLCCKKVEMKFYWLLLFLFMGLSFSHAQNLSLIHI